MNNHSPYYPPRARWYSRLWGRRHLRSLGSYWEAIEKWCTSFRLASFFLSLVVPGFGFFACGLRKIGRAVVTGYLLAALVFVVWLGTPVAALAFGLMLSLHMSGIMYLLDHRISGLTFVKRILLASALLIVISQLIYFPLRSQAQTRWVMPLFIRNRVILVKTRILPGSLQRGDWVAYRINAGNVNSGGDIHGGVADGLGLEQVLAIPGDQVRFTPKDFQVNDVSHPRHPHMPMKDEWVVPEKKWFIWPDGIIVSGGGERGADLVMTLMTKVAMVPENDLMGKPYDRWFWRRQTLP